MKLYLMPDILPPASAQDDIRDAAMVLAISRVWAIAAGAGFAFLLPGEAALSHTYWLAKCLSKPARLASPAGERLVYHRRR